MTTLSNTARAALRAFAPALALAVAGLTVACADGPAAPRAAAGAPAYGKTATTTTATTTTTTAVKVKPLARLTGLDADVSKSWAVTSAGATLAWPELGLTIVVPQGAVGKAGLTITARAPKGKTVAYDFSPDGSRFAAPLQLTQSTAGTDFAAVADPARIEGGYFKSAAQIDEATGSALVDEFLPARVDAAAGRITFQVSHFSGYLMSTGRE